MAKRKSRERARQSRKGCIKPEALLHLLAATPKDESTPTLAELVEDAVRRTDELISAAEYELYVGPSAVGAAIERVLAALHRVNEAETPAKRSRIGSKRTARLSDLAPTVYQIRPAIPRRGPALVREGDVAVVCPNGPPADEAKQSALRDVVAARERLRLAQAALDAGDQERAASEYESAALLMRKASDERDAAIGRRCRQGPRKRLPSTEERESALADFRRRADLGEKLTVLDRIVGEEYGWGETKMRKMRLEAGIRKSARRR